MGKIIKASSNDTYIKRSILTTDTSVLVRDNLERIGITWYSGAPDVFPKDGRAAGVIGYQDVIGGVNTLMQHKPAVGGWTGLQSTPEYIAHITHDELAVLDIYSYRVAQQSIFLKPSATNDGGFYHYKLYLRFSPNGTRQYQCVPVLMNNNGGDRIQGNYNLQWNTSFSSGNWQNWPDAQWGDAADWARIHEVVITTGRGWVANIRFAQDGGIEIGGQRNGGERAETITVLCPQVKIFNHPDIYNGEENGTAKIVTKAIPYNNKKIKKIYETFDNGRITNWDTFNEITANQWYNTWKDIAGWTTPTGWHDCSKLPNLELVIEGVRYRVNKSSVNGWYNQGNGDLIGFYLEKHPYASTPTVNAVAGIKKAAANANAGWTLCDKQPDALCYRNDTTPNSVDANTLVSTGGGLYTASKVLSLKQIDDNTLLTGTTGETTTSILGVNLTARRTFVAGQDDGIGAGDFSNGGNVGGQWKIPDNQNIPTPLSFYIRKGTALYANYHIDNGGGIGRDSWGVGTNYALEGDIKSLVAKTANGLKVTVYVWVEGIGNDEWVNITQHMQYHLGRQNFVNKGAMFQGENPGGGWDGANRLEVVNYIFHKDGTIDIVDDLGRPYQETKTHITAGDRMVSFNLPYATETGDWLQNGYGGGLVLDPTTCNIKNYIKWHQASDNQGILSVVTDIKISEL